MTNLVFENLKEYNEFNFFTSILEEVKEKDYSKKEFEKSKKNKDPKEDDSQNEERVIGDKLIKRIISDYKGFLKSLGPVLEKSTLKKIKNFCETNYKTAEKLNSEFLKLGGKVSIPFELSSPISKDVKAPIFYPLASGNYVAFICDDSNSGARQLCIKGGKEDIISKDKKTILDFISFVKSIYKEFKDVLIQYRKETQKKNVDDFLKTKSSGEEKVEESYRVNEKNKII